MQDHFRSDFADHVSLQARGIITDTAGCRRAGRLYFALRRRQSEGKPTRSKKGKKAMNKFIAAAALVATQ
jgi:hypothetical protein